MLSTLSDFQNKNFLITTSQWFIAPDGKSYRSVWGKVALLRDEDTLGIKTNARSANWYAVVGEGDTRVIVAGCQIHYACICENVPNTDVVKEQRFVESKGESVLFDRENIIYLAQASGESHALSMVDFDAALNVVREKLNSVLKNNLL